MAHAVGEHERMHSESAARREHWNIAGGDYGKREWTLT